MRILIGIIVVLVPVVSLCLASLIIDNHRFVVRRYCVQTAKVDQPIRLVFLSDLHNKVYGKDNEAIFATLRSTHPDAILIGGDMTIAKPAIHGAFRGDLSGMDAALTFLAQLPAIAPTYFVNGNHEQRIYETGQRSEDERYLATRRMYDHFCTELDRMGVHQLHNAHTDLTPEIMLYGYEHTCEHYEKLFSNPIPEDDVAQRVGEPDAGRYNILIAHNPKFFATYARWGADLVLSGHVHGGLMRIGRLGFIGPDLHLFPRYSGGSYFAENAQMILSCGLGAHTLPIRIFNPGEISVVEIQPENQ